MDATTEDLKVEQNIEAHRFEVRLGDDVARLEYRLRDSTISFTHTFVPRSLDRQGVAGVVARHGLDYARANGLKVAPLCPYVAYCIGQHPEDLVAAWSRGKL